MKILSIETSCDDTGIAILRVSETCKFDVLSNIVSSQTEVHKKYGGVYPTMAKREHQKNLVPTFAKALKDANMLKEKNKKNLTPNTQHLKSILEREQELYKKLILFLQKYEKPDIDLIAVTNGPGLEPCLWVGVNFAKALSYFWNIPVVPVNHIEAHILVNFLNQKSRPVDRSTGPAIVLVVSGGHTQIILMKKIGDYKILGETRDDAAGECFDKCAKILGLGYPGGPAISKLASKWNFQFPISNFQSNPNDQILKLPRPMINTKDYDFSFSGLKTAMLYSWRKLQEENSPFFATRQKTATLQASFASEVQQAIIDVLLKKTIKAAKDFKAKTIILGGGVSANQELRRQFKLALANGSSRGEPLNLLFPPANLSTDNGLMTAITGYFHRNKKVAPSRVATIRANGNLRIGK